MMNLRNKFVFLCLSACAMASCGAGEPTSSSISPSTESSSKTSSEEPTSISSSESSTSEESSSSTIPLEEVTREEALESLKGRYSERITTSEKIGLSDLSRVGVDKDALDNETLYPTPEEGVTVYRVEDYEVSVNNTNNSRALQALVDTLRTQSGKKVISFGEGTYRFNSAIQVTNASDIYFLGHNTKWVLNAWTTYLSFSGTENIHVEGFTFDMDPSPTVAGTVKSYSYDASGNCDVVLSLPEEFDCSASAYTSWDPNGNSNYTGSFMECIRDPISGKLSPDRNKNLFYNSTTSANNFGMLSMTYSKAAHELTVKLNKKFPYCSLKNPTIGGWVSVAYTMYDHFGFSLTKAKDTYFEHVTTYVAAGMGLRANAGENLYLNHVNFIQDPNSARIMTCTADIIHTCALEGDLRITNCILESSHDDALNIKSFYGKITSIVKSSREITIDQTQNECAIRFEEGDDIDFYDPETMEYIDTYHVVSSTCSGTTYRVIVDRRPNNLVEGYSAGNDTRSTRMYLHNCLIQNKRNRGILLQTRYSEISQCTFHNVIMGAVQMLSVGDIFREAIAPKEIIFKDNKIVRCQGGDLSIFAYGTSGNSVAGAIRDITVENNYFYNGPTSAITTRSVNGLRIAHNLMHYPELSSRSLITVRQTLDATIEDNLAYIDNSYSNVTMVTENEGCSNITQANNEIMGGRN